MNNIKFILLETFFFKSILRSYFNFLVENFNFVETTDPKLVISDWLILGIAYTNHKCVIICGDDILEKRFTIIKYDIQADFKIPLYDKEHYYTLEDIVHEKENLNESLETSCWNTSNDRKRCIEKSIFYMNKYSNLFELFNHNN